MDDEAQWRAAIGENADRYLKHFRKISASGRRWLPGWNWSAFWHSTAWFWYRRMYGWALANLLAPWILLHGAAWLEDLYDEPPFPLVSPTFFAYLGFVFIVVPAFANALYFRHLAARLPRAKPPSQWNWAGAGAMVLVWCAVPVFLYVFVFGRMVGHAVIMSEVILGATEMRTRVTEFHARHQRFPDAEEGAALAVYGQPPFRYVQAIVWDPGQRAIIITSTHSFPGSRVALRAIEQNGQLEWKCGPLDIDRKRMPRSCRN